MAADMWLVTLDAVKASFGAYGPVWNLKADIKREYNDDDNNKT